MKISKLYSNLPELFPSIRFNEGLNVIMAEIHNPENLKKDTHNLGKTTIANLIDFCLLKKRSKKFFLFKHQRFRQFVFFLELRLDANRFLTIRRGVTDSSKISFHYTLKPFANLKGLPAKDWNHWCVSFDKAKELLKAQLGFSIATTWTFRKPLGYALRLQDDYQDVFQLRKFRGLHRDWKPFLAEFHGFDGRLIQKNYDLTDQIKTIKQSIAKLKRQLIGVVSSDKLDGIILFNSIKIKDFERKLANFDFKIPDQNISENLVNNIENKIAIYNERRYHLKMSLQVIDNTLDEVIKFDLVTIERIFTEAKVYFGNQLRQDYNGLMLFLESISKERSELLLIERLEIIKKLKKIDGELLNLNQNRIDALIVLRKAKSLEKYTRAN